MFLLYTTSEQPPRAQLLWLPEDPGFFFFLRFYLFIHERQREAETQAEGEAGSMQGAQRGT